MLASLYDAPVWVFYRDTETLTHFSDLRGHRVAIGIKGSGARASSEALFKLNHLSSDNVTIFRWTIVPR